MLGIGPITHGRRIGSDRISMHSQRWGERDESVNKLTFRPGRPDEASLLNEMTMAGVRWYQHDAATEDLLENLESMIETGNPKEVVTVAEMEDTIVGFYGLVDEGAFVDLLRMFLRTDSIGMGYGTQLWNNAVEVAATTHGRMRIVADPGARHFYESKGAILETEMEPAPGFVLGVYWFDLKNNS